MREDMELARQELAARLEVLTDKERRQLELTGEPEQVDYRVVKDFSLLVRAVAFEGLGNIGATAEALATSQELALGYHAMLENGNASGLRTLRAMTWAAMYDQSARRTQMGRNRGARRATRVLKQFRDRAREAGARYQEQWCEGLLPA